MPITKIDYLIVGQGLAGSLLAHSLIEHGQSVMVIDNHHHQSSSQVAAGIINPVTGHRLNITEGFKIYYPIAKQFYQELEECYSKLNQSTVASIFKEIKQTRLIKNPGQAGYFSKRLVQSDYDDVLAETTKQNFSHAPHGCADVKHTAVVDTKTLLQNTKSWLVERNALCNENISYDQLQFSDAHIIYKDIQARRIIFCEGYQAINNPLLSHLPFKLARGDILTVATAPTLSAMLSWGQWLVPAANNTAKLGASFDWNSLDLTPKPEAAAKLLDSLTANTTLVSELLKHEVGIRPTTRQRKPFVGPLSKQVNAYCLNGLGSKGCLIAPFYVKNLTDHLLQNSPLDEGITQWL